MKAYPWWLIVLLFQVKRCLHISMVRGWLWARDLQHRSQSRYKSTVHQPGLKKLFFWVNLYLGAWAGSPRYQGSAFLGLTLQLPLGGLQNCLVLLCKESWRGPLGLGIVHLWVSCVRRKRGRHHHGESQCH